MAEVLVASITALCAADHRNDPDVIARWTANKTPDGVAAMRDNPANTMLVAESDGTVAAVGMVVGADEIGLNYVHPNHRFKGASTALLAAMEELMRARGVTTARVKSTVTAHEFYLARGWADDGPIYTGRFIDAYRMTKMLQPAQ
jgi:GNAT superfamily N-acetyltransferase